VHSLDRLALAEALDRSRPPHLPPLDVCLQINISGEGSKGGVAPEAALPLAEAVARLPRLRLRGLMGMASPVKEEARQRAEFRKLADTLTLLRSHLPQPAALDTLSMGMSHDLEAAIAEGATLVRIGTALFGEREKLA
jgi:pyridoxal phosphate enzyme (YggS family)